MKELKFATASRRIVTVETPCRCGKVTCQKRFQAPAPSTVRGAQQLVGHGLQAGHQHDHGEGELAPDVHHDQRRQDGADVVDEVRRPVGDAEPTEHARR